MTDISEVVKNVSETMQATNDKVKKIKERASKEMEKQFREVFDQLFDAYPRLHSIAWTQYTPHFNDGDECVFQAHTDYLTINGFSEYGEIQEECGGEHPTEWEDLQSLAMKEKWDDKLKKFVRNKPEPEATEIIENINTIFNAVDNEMLRDAFGDHALVIVTKGKITVEEYEHD